LRNGNYMIAAGNFGGKVLVTGNATLYVTRTASVAFSGNDFIKIDPNASLKLYVGSPSARIGGNGVLNHSGSALDFQYYGLPSNTSLALGGNAEFRGTIYAPNADLTLNGGGNDVTDFIGSSITKTATMNGKFNFHYDEALGRVGPSRGYIITSWQEV
ncbi:MAG TPA: collagen-binding domain-containing protein, partial [Methylomirabilota bacterium]|nr:collagen-binding domain-containing protein [Methylomirabilota bacterium]